MLHDASLINVCQKVVQGMQNIWNSRFEIFALGPLLETRADPETVETIASEKVWSEQSLYAFTTNRTVRVLRLDCDDT